MWTDWKGAACSRGGLPCLPTFGRPGNAKRWPHGRGRGFISPPRIHDGRVPAAAARKMWSFLLLSLLPAASSAAFCKAFPNTYSWPSASKWSELNSAVHGRLEAVVPPAAVCYETFNGVNTSDAAKCQAYRDGYSQYDAHLGSPVSIYWEFWTNRTCVPTKDPTGKCTRGAYPNYVIKAESVTDVQAGVDFARTNNVRLWVSLDTR